MKSYSVRKCKNKSKIHPALWRDHLDSLDYTNNTHHKMSSVTNNFMSDDREYDDHHHDPFTSEAELIITPRHNDPIRTSPLSSSFSSIGEGEAEAEEKDLFSDIDIPIEETTPYNNTQTLYEEHCPRTDTRYSDAPVDFGMSWNPKQNQWVSLIYRYVFPATAFDIPRSTAEGSSSRRFTWSINSKHNTSSSSCSSAVKLDESEQKSFTFPPQQESIMMGNHPSSTDSDARDACLKLLDLIDDENLIINRTPRKTTTTTPAIRSLHSEWSSLPSSPPPPIFHDVCNRPIPELRLSPPMTGKSLGKRLFPSVMTAAGTSAAESPLSKRLRFSSSSTSLV